MKTSWKFYAEWGTVFVIILFLVFGIIYLMHGSHQFVAFNIAAKDLSIDTNVK